MRDSVQLVYDLYAGRGVRLSATVGATRVELWQLQPLQLDLACLAVDNRALHWQRFQRRMPPVVLGGQGRTFGLDLCPCHSANISLSSVSEAVAF